MNGANSSIFAMQWYNKSLKKDGQIVLNILYTRKGWTSVHPARRLYDVRRNQ